MPEIKKTNDDSSVVLINGLVRIKRELTGADAPDESTQKIINRIFSHNIPAVFRKNFINGEDRLYISSTDIKFPGSTYSVDVEHFGKAMPHVIKKLKDLGIEAEVSSSMLIVSRKDLAAVADSNDIDPIEEDTDFTVNSTGVYR